MSALWHACDVITATAGTTGTIETPRAASWIASGLSIDSRDLEAGDLFVAIKGPHHDGHDFVDEAFKKGAVAAIVERSFAERSLAASGDLIQVQDSHRALIALGRAARARASEVRVAAITGSVGKTAVKDGLALALASKGVEVHAALHSLNNHWGVPLTLARMPPQSDFGVFEIGMNHAGEISPLARLVEPDLVIITQIAEAHLAFFKTLHEIAEAKAEIFDGLKQGGSVVLNRDGAFYDFLSDQARKKNAAQVISFGESERSDVQLMDMRVSSEGAGASEGAQVRVRIFDRELEFSLFMPARALALNALAVLCAVHLLGGDVEAAAARLGRYRPRAGRGARAQIDIGSGAITLIDESYNANPASMRAAFEVLSALDVPAGGRRIAVLGDMHELGEAAIDLHRALLEPLCAAKVDMVFACGEKMEYLYDVLPPSLRGGYAPAPRELIEVLRKTLSGGDIIMVKGSHAAGLDQIVAALKDDG